MEVGGNWPLEGAESEGRVSPRESVMGAGAPQALGVASGAQRTERMDPRHFNPLSLDHRSAPPGPRFSFIF